MSQEETKEEKVPDTKQYIGLNDVVLDKEFEDELYKNDSPWEELGVPEEIILALKARGFKRPSLIQKKVIKQIMKFSMCAQSQNGSGKTLAYLIPSLMFLLQNKPQS